MSITLINFNVPSRLKERFDSVCHASGRTRTSVLHELMSDYVLLQGRALVTRNDALDDIDEFLRYCLALAEDTSDPDEGSNAIGAGGQIRSNPDFATADLQLSVEQ